MIDENYTAAHDFVTCVSWVRRGVPKQKPTEIQYDREELRQMITRTKRQLVESGDATDQAEFIEQANQLDMEMDEVPQQSTDPEDDEIVRKYGLDTYDNESDEEASNVIGGFGNLVQHADNQDDPYLQQNDDHNDSESEMEDFMIQPNDNLLLVGHVQEDASSLDVYVYNDEDNYVHHDVILPAFPMCFESIEYDCEKKCAANLMAIGDMTKLIHIWDLDIVNELEPKITLKGHKDSVLGLSWNRNVTNVLASCSVDMTVRLWDLNVNKSIHKLAKFSERIQSIEFHPIQSEKLLAGDCSGRITLIDCNSFELRNFSISNCEIEKVAWNPHSSNIFVASTDKGMIETFDLRSPQSINRTEAHADSVTDLAFSRKCPNLLVSAGADQKIKVWDTASNRMKLVHEYDQANVGKIFALSANPDLPFVFAVGGDNRLKNLEVIDISNIDNIKNHFQSRLII